MCVCVCVWKRRPKGVEVDPVHTCTHMHGWQPRGRACAGVMPFVQYEMSPPAAPAAQTHTPKQTPKHTPIHTRFVSRHDVRRSTTTFDRRKRSSSFQHDPCHAGCRRVLSSVGMVSKLRTSMHPTSTPLHPYIPTPLHPDTTTHGTSNGAASQSCPCRRRSSRRRGCTS